MHLNTPTPIRRRRRPRTQPRGGSEPVLRTGSPSRIQLNSRAYLNLNVGQTITRPDTSVQTSGPPSDIGALLPLRSFDTEPPSILPNFGRNLVAAIPSVPESVPTPTRTQCPPPGERGPAEIDDEQVDQLLQTEGSQSDLSSSQKQASGTPRHLITMIVVF